MSNRASSSLSGASAGGSGSIPWLEKRMAAHSSIHAWEIPRTEQSGRRQCLGAHRVRYGRVTNSSNNGTATPGPVCVVAFLWASAWLPPIPLLPVTILLRDGIPGRPHLFPLNSLHSSQSSAKSGCVIEQTVKTFSEHNSTRRQSARICPGMEASGDEPGCLLWHLSSASPADIGAA